MKQHKVTLQTYSQSTSFDIDLSDNEFELLKDIEKATENYMVTLSVSEGTDEGQE